MRLASKGLGKITLPFRFTEAAISEVPDCLVLEGAIKEKKVNWTYRAEVEDSDILNFVILARDPVVVRYLVARVGFGVFATAGRAALKLLFHPFRSALAANVKPQGAAAASEDRVRVGAERS